MVGPQPNRPDTGRQVLKAIAQMIMGTSLGRRKTIFTETATEF
jgi:hypothetical protein